MVVIPSVVDLDPQVQIEAMASGKLVIGTNVGTMPRRITDGLSGFIVEPADEAVPQGQQGGKAKQGRAVTAEQQGSRGGDQEKAPSRCRRMLELLKS